MNPTKSLFSAFLAASLLFFASTGNAAESGMTIRGGSYVENPPKHIAPKKPKREDFNAIFDGFLELDYVDITKGALDPRLTELFGSETSNALYNRLKLSEKKYDGAILISAVAVDDEQIVVIAARISYQRSGTKMLESEYINIVFLRNGKFKEVRKGVATKQQL